MLNQTQVSTVQPLGESIPFPETLQFGHVTLTNDFQRFLEAIEYAIAGHLEVDRDTTTMSVRELLAFLKRELDCIDEEVPRYWRIGCLVGKIIGFLYPTLSTNNPSQTYLESLSGSFQS
jgi:hypothetical protein